MSAGTPNPVLSEGARSARVDRLERVRQAMDHQGIDALLLSHGADLPWLTGYSAMPLERLTLLVVPRRGTPVLVVPGLEAPRVPDSGGMVELAPWSDAEDPMALVTDLLRRAGATAGRLGISDRAWATTVLGLQRHLPEARWREASAVTAPLRAVKDATELEALRRAGAAADRVAAALQAGEIPMVGRREADVSAELGARLLAEGHFQVNFAIVGSGPNAASPHHEPGERVIQAGETVVCDFGGALALDGDVGYCSDITRTVVTGEPTAEVGEAYEVLRRAQQAGVAAARAGVTAASVDAVTRTVIDEAGWGEYFIHRTGHGIGIEEHEDPYIVVGNETVLESGHAFSVEPGIYVPGRFGMRLEDIVIIDEQGGPERLNRADHALAVVESGVAP